MSIASLTFATFPLVGLVLGLAVGLDHGSWVWGALLGAGAGALLHLTLWQLVELAARVQGGAPRR